MVNKSGNIGTAGETGVARYLVADGWPSAERRRLRGRFDRGDITGTPGVVWEVKNGKEAKGASDGLVTKWLAETETERRNASADYGVLVLARAGIAPRRAGEWWAVVSGEVFVKLATGEWEPIAVGSVRCWLSDVVYLLRRAGYGDPL